MLNAFPLPLISEVIERVAAWHGITTEEILGRDKHNRQASHELMWVLRRRGLSYPRIGKVTNRDHSTCFQAIKKIEADPVALERVERLERSA